MQSVTSNAVAQALETGTIADKTFTQNGTVNIKNIQKFGKLRIALIEIFCPTGSNIGTYNGVVLVNDTGFRPVSTAWGDIVNVHTSTIFHGRVALDTNGKLNLTESWGMTSGSSIAYSIIVWVES